MDAYKSKCGVCNELIVDTYIWKDGKYYHIDCGTDKKNICKECGKIL